MASEKDVTYAQASSGAQQLDIYRPDGASKRAAILFFHGGGWRGGAREMMRPLAREMAARGYVGLPISYRLLGAAPFPAQLEDVVAAVQWTRAQAETLGIDPARIILWGSSAGAHLSLLAAGAEATRAPVAGVVAVHPPVAFHVGAQTERHTTAATSLLGAAATEAEARAASPLHHVSAAFPPTLLLHGSYDRMVNHAASEEMFTALRAAKAPADLHLFHGHNHGFEAIPTMRTLICTLADAFIERTILNADSAAAEAEEFSMFARRAAEEQRAASQNA